jgi:ATP-dependent DNA helicase RecG
MSPDELRKRIARGENLTTEFKVAGIHPDDLAASLVAFANSDGGDLFFGVSDRGETAGKTELDALGRQIDNVSRSNCLPPVTVVPEQVEIDGKRFLVVHVPRGEERPYATNRGVHYVRTFSGRRQAARAEILRLFQASESLLSDDQVVHGTGASDLDFSYFERFLLQAYGKKLEDFLVPRDQLLRNLRLARNGHLTAAGLLLFGRDVQRFLPHAQVNAARFPGNELADAPEDRKDFGGKLADQLDSALGFVNLHLRVRHEIRGMEPERFPELPQEALREVLVNALVHRDYTVRGPVRLLVFSDRVEVHSPGRPPNTVDVEAMKLGTHVPRNPILLTHFAKMGYVTSLGTGIPRVFKLVTEATGREPEVVVRGFEVLVSIPRPAIHSAMRMPAARL